MTQGSSTSLPVAAHTRFSGALLPGGDGSAGG